MKQTKSQKTPKKEKEIDKRIRAEALAEKVKLLLAFVGDFVADIDLLEEISKKAPGRVSDVLTMAPILGAFGQDYEEIEFKRKLEARRAIALYELVLAIKETEDERKKFGEDQLKKAEGRAQLARILGGF